MMGPAPIWKVTTNSRLRNQRYLIQAADLRSTRLDAFCVVTPDLVATPEPVLSHPRTWEEFQFA